MESTLTLAEMEEHVSTASACLKVTDGLLVEARQICDMTSPPSDLWSLVPRLLDVVQHVQSAVRSPEMFPGPVLLEMVECFACTNGCAEQVAEQFDAVGRHETAQSLRARAAQ